MGGLRHCVFCLLVAATWLACSAEAAEFLAGGEKVMIRKRAGEIVSVAAGEIFATRAGRRLMVLRGLPESPEMRNAEEIDLPAAALSSADVAVDGEPCERSGAKDERLAALLEVFQKQPDLPRETAQLAVFAVLEDIDFSKWRGWRAPAGMEPKPPTPAEVVQAVDALTILRYAFPERSFALLADADLRHRALRNPWARSKAATLYGLTLPGDAAPAGVPPDLGSLLHTKPGDNCPICRLRTPPEQNVP